MMKRGSMRSAFLILVLVLVPSLPIAAQSSVKGYSLSLELSPAASAPLTRTDLFGTGGGLDLGLRWELPFTGILSFEAGFGYRLDPVGALDSLSVLNTDGGLALSIPIGDLSIAVSARGGYWWAFRNQETSSTASNPSLSAGLSVFWRVMPAMSLSTGAAWRSYLGLHDTANVSIGAVWHLLDAEGRRRLLNVDPVLLGESEAPRSGSGLELSDSDFNPIYPVLFKQYDTVAVGTAHLVNRSRKTIDDIEVTLYDPQYMSTPAPCEAPKSMKGGTSADVALHALFKADVLGLSEGTKVMARIAVAYTLEGRRYRFETMVPLSFLHRNAISWDDDRKAAAFVTAKDPAILRFARAAASAVDALPSGELSPSFLYAMAIFDALGVAGMNYKADPVTPYSKLSTDALAVDYLQFPVQTLEYRSGDCDDLSVLYCALLESIGVETAFVTVPGHIFCAFALDETGAAWFSSTGDFIKREGKYWIPVETTLAGKGFLEAWRSGAQTWSSAQAVAALVPTRAAWATYPPVGFDIRTGSPEPPAADRIASRTAADLAWLAEREVRPRLSALDKEAGASAKDPRYRNKVGIILAKYGLTDKAELEFKAAAAAGYGAAHVNLGNLQFRAGKLEVALASYRRAAGLGPTLEAPALEGVIRCYSALGDRTGYTDTLARLKVIDPARAERFAFLAEASGERASTISQGGMTWVE